METLERIYETVRTVVDWPLFSLGGTTFTVGKVLLILVILIATVSLTRRVRDLAIARLMKRPGMHQGVAHALGSFIRYILVFIALVVLVSTIGLDLSSLVVVAGFFGLGIGLGLQGITNDFISGLVLLLERPIKMGDRVEVGELAGSVARISPRATTIVTNDNVTVIVPNSQFVSGRVVNWSHAETEVRIKIAVPVAYDSDPEVVKRVLLEVAAASPGVAQHRTSDVLFDRFGESALEFNLRVWTRDFASQPGVLRSELNYAILKALRAAKIEVPFPQRVVHMRGGSPAQTT